MKLFYPKNHQKIIYRLYKIFINLNIFNFPWLSHKYYGPYEVLQKISTMGYKLEMHASSRVHHFSMLHA